MSLAIDSRVELQHMLASGRVIRAQWAVLCEIGPDWIGAGRRFRFWIDETPLRADCVAHRVLAKSIVDFFALPSSHESEATHGLAIMQWRGDALWIDYEWSRGVPYQDSSGSHADVALFELSDESAG